MRKILLGLLMLVMLTPALACGAAMICVKQAQASQPAEEAPCHGQKQQDSGDNVQTALMLFKDCTGVDLAKSDSGPATVKKPELQKSFGVMAWIDFAADTGFDLSATYQIRGPPPDFSGIATSPPILLTTRRFRI